MRESQSSHLTRIANENSRPILIVRMSAMGDIIHAMPAVSALRAALPQARIGWVIEERWSPLLTARSGDARRGGSCDDSQPLAECVYTVEMKRWRAHPLSASTRSNIRALKQQLRAANYEAAIDLQGAVRSALAAAASRAPAIVGAARPREWPARLWYTHRVETPGRHVVEQAAETIAGWLRHPLVPTTTLFPVDGEAERWCEREIAGARFSILNPGAGWGAKCWPAERYGVVARELAAAGILPIVNAGPGEQPLAEGVRQASAGKARVVECSLAQLIALTRRAELFIGGDTGPMHLAAALAIPVVGIFGPTDPERNGPFGAPAVVLRHPQSRRDHSRRTEPEAGLLTISPDEVSQAARQLLAARKEPARRG